jgi:hypothetical protein
MASRSRRKAALRTAVHPSCPVPNTHRRLEAAHRLWHEALKHYDDPNAFRTFLNATIQELRNLTWVLQKEKFAAPGFDEWYASWRERLASSEAARWVVELRNKVVKEGDLATSSRVDVRYFVDYRQVDVFSFDGPPTASSRDIAFNFARSAPPELRRVGDGILVVERRWETTALPGRELLEALASAYGLLADLVKDAHQFVGSTNCGLVGCGRRGAYAAEFLAGRPECMAVSQDARTSVVDLQHGRFREVRSKAVKRPSEREQEDLRRKYAGVSLTLADWKGLKDMPLRDQARALHEIGLKLLRADGFLMQTFHMFRDRKVVRLLGMIRPDERTDLHVFMLRVRADVERTRADSLICSNEVWLGTSASGLRASEDPERREAVNTAAVDREGCRFALTTLFHRESGGVVLERTSEEEGASLPFLQPVLELWRTAGENLG